MASSEGSEVSLRDDAGNEACLRRSGGGGDNVLEGEEAPASRPARGDTVDTCNDDNGDNGVGNYAFRGADLDSLAGVMLVKMSVRMLLLATHEARRGGKGVHLSREERGKEKAHSARAGWVGVAREEAPVASSSSLEVEMLLVQLAQAVTEHCRVPSSSSSSKRFVNVRLFSSLGISLPPSSSSSLSSMIDPAGALTAGKSQESAAAASETFDSSISISEGRCRLLLLADLARRVVHMDFSL